MRNESTVDVSPKNSETCKQYKNRIDVLVEEKKIESVSKLPFSHWWIYQRGRGNLQGDNPDLIINN